MGITVLGPLTIDGSGRLSRRDRVVLETLATRPGHPVSADQLADALWADQPPASAAKVLQGCIVRLRKELGPEAIETCSHGYLLTVPPDQVDAQRFERMVVRARELLSLGEDDRAAYQLTEALTLWTGQPFADLENWAPAVEEARRLGELRLEAEELRVDAHLRVGRHREVLAECQAMVRAAPLRERRWTLQAHAQYQAGQQAEALRTIHQLRSMLVQQLGIDPGPDVTALEQAILRQDASLLVRGTIAASHGTCPWQGLKAYEIDDADRFFGRQDDVDGCLEILRRTPVLTLVGPSGSGKSSILRAGVAAALRSRGQPCVVLTPGPHPMEALTELAGASPATVLFVDQFEEVFSLCDDPAEQQEFVRALTTEAASRIVVLALRADHLADLVTHAGFARLVEQGLYLVGGLSEEGLRDAVEAPARRSGLVIEPGLVDLLVREVRDDPGALPLLSHALLETWKRREGNTLTVAGYRASGGIYGAVAQSAERLYAQIDTDRRHLLRDLVLRLVSPGLQGEPVRSRVPRRLVATDVERDRLIEMLVGARLVTSDDGVLEITHEALARAWPRLQGWLDDDVEGQRMLHHLSAAADAWDSLGRPESELYRGVRLARTLDWQGRTRSTLTDAEREFLEAARSNAEAEEQSAVERERAQTRLIRRLRLVLTGAVVLLVLALAAGGLAAVQSKHASDNATAALTAEAAAKQQALTAQVRQAGARAAVVDDVDTSLLLALAAVKLEDSPASLSSLMGVLAKRPALIESTPLPGNEVMAIDVSPDGNRVATVDTTHAVRLVNVASGEFLTRQEGPARRENDDARALQFSPDGRVLAVGRTPFSGAPVELLDARTLEVLPTQLGGLPSGRWKASDLYFSEDGESVAVAIQKIVTRGDSRETVATRAAVWRLRRPGQPRIVPLSNDVGWVSVALSPDGGLLYTLPSRVVHNMRTGTETTFFPNEINFNAGGLEVSPDGRKLAFGRGIPENGPPGGAVVLDSGTGRVLHSVAGGVVVSDVRFSANGERVLTTDYGSPRQTQVWDSDSGEQLADLALTGGSERAVAMDPSGQTVFSAGPDHALRQWNVDGGRRYLRRIPVPGLPWATKASGGSCFTTPSSGGQFVMYLPCGFLSAKLANAYLLLDVARRQTHLVREAYSGWHWGGGSWRPSTTTFIRADGGTIRAFDGRTGAVLSTSHPLGDHVVDVDHTPDESMVVAAEQEGRITMLDADTMKRVGRPVDLGVPVLAVSAGPDNRTAFVLTGGPDLPEFWNVPARRWALVDLDKGTVVNEGPLDLDAGNWAAYSPDGQHAVATGAHGEVEIIDLATGQPVGPTVIAHSDGAFWAAFSPDGSRLVTAAGDGSVVLWDTDTAAQVARITIPVPGLVSAEFRPDGHTLLVAPWGQDAAVYVWNPTSARAVQFACRAVGRDLTEEEWRDNFGGQPYQSTCPNG
ncbi:MAG: transcriptional regulator, family [Nocardioides sp.]|nr:transcriptional regulator, family [Nocardioides sp.]